MKMAMRNSRVVQVSNIAPQVTKDQMRVLFSFLGIIEDIRLYPTIRDASYPVNSRICYIKFVDASTVPVALNFTDTVFIDRPLIVIPMSEEEIPDECYVLEMTQHGIVVPGLPNKDPKLPPHVVNLVNRSGKDQVILSTDTNLESNDLPPYPPLPGNFDSAMIEETRRTIFMLNYNPAVTTDEIVDFLRPAGEIECLKMCKRESDESTCMLVEFTDQPSIINALKMNGMDFKGRAVEIQHATKPIMKLQIKSNEAAQQEVEETALRLKEEQCYKDACKEPVTGIRRSKSRSSGTTKSSSSSSRSRRGSRSRRRRSRSRRGRSTSRSLRSSSRKRNRSSSRSRSRNWLKPRRRRSTSRRRSRSGDRNRRSRNEYRKTTIQSRDRDRDSSSETKRSTDDRKSRGQAASKVEVRDKDEYRSSKRSRNSSRRSPSPQASKKRKDRSRSRNRDRKREKKSNRRY